MTIELFLISSLRALAEVAGLSLLGQGIVGLLAGSHRGGNPIYQLFRIVTAPVIRLTRLIMPATVSERWLPVLAFAGLLLLWITLAIVRRLICADAAPGCA